MHTWNKNKHNTVCQGHESIKRLEENRGKKSKGKLVSKRKRETKTQRKWKRQKTGEKV